MAPPSRNPEFTTTTRILDRNTPRRFSADPDAAVTAYAPPSEDLVALSARQFPESRDAPGDPESGRRRTLPPTAPDWMHAARAMSEALERLIARASVDSKELAAVERMWAAWTLGGVTPRQALKVAHLVRRAHTAIRETIRDDDIAIRDCAEIVHQGLPTAVRQSMPFERALLVVRALRREADPWRAVVEGSSELLGWADYARMFAASILRIVIEESR